jgi:hypothetical protein
MTEAVTINAVMNTLADPTPTPRVLEAGRLGRRASRAPLGLLSRRAECSMVIRRMVAIADKRNATEEKTWPYRKFAQDQHDSALREH